MVKCFKGNLIKIKKRKIYTTHQFTTEIGTITGTLLIVESRSTLQMKALKVVSSLGVGWISQKKSDKIIELGE